MGRPTQNARPRPDNVSSSIKVDGSMREASDEFLSTINNADAADVAVQSLGISAEPIRRYIPMIEVGHARGES